jgi:hypothetical protein
MWAILLTVAYFSIQSKGPFRFTIPVMAAMIFLLYLVGELNGKHSIEILFYWFAMLAALQLPAGLNHYKSIHQRSDETTLRSKKTI